MKTFDGIRLEIGEWISGSELSAYLSEYDISDDNFREAVITYRLSAYDKNGLKLIHAPFSANWTQDPPGCKYTDFEFMSVFEVFFKGDDFNKFLSNFRSSSDAKIEAKPEHKDSESFIRSLQVSHVSDTEIRIKIDGKKAKTYEMKKLGFKKVTSKTWKEFIGIIKSNDHLYHVGTAHGAQGARKESYDVAQKVLVEINKKLVSFLNENYQAQLPERFKVYELRPEKKEAPGTYRFKFQITNNEDADIESFKALPKNQLLQQIIKLSAHKKTLSEKGDGKAGSKLDKISDQLSAAVEIACKKDYLSQNRASYYLNPTEDPLPD